MLQVRGITKRYGEVTALAGIDLEVRTGEVYALLGTNGAGKTTLFRILMGIHSLDAGEVQWDLGAGSWASRVGYLPEERGLQQDVPIARTLTFLGRLRGLDKAGARRACTTWLERMQLIERAEDKLDTLSKGNQQKVQIAAALLHEPVFALLDEPFSGFDPLNQELLLELIGELRERGTTVLFSAHQLDLVERACDRVGLLDRGRLVTEGTLAELRRAGSAEQRWSVELDLEAAAADGLHRALREIPGLTIHEDLGEGRYLVSFDPSVAVSDSLAALTRAVPVRALAAREPTLHDLYLGTVRGGNDA